MVEHNTSKIGTEFKITFSHEPIDGRPISEMDFSAIVSTDRGGKPKKYEKNDCIKIDEDTYAAPVDSAEIGYGRYFIDIILHVPDTHFPAGYRKEIKTYYSGKEILP